MCNDPPWILKSAFPLTNRTQIGDTIIYQCKNGYTRRRENRDRITCLDDGGVLEWAGGQLLEDCEFNYCNLSNLLTKNAERVNFTKGNMPEGVLPNDFQLFEGSLLTYRCFTNFHLNNSEYFTTRCVYPKHQIGFGHWDPEQALCKRKHINTTCPFI